MAGNVDVRSALDEVQQVLDEGTESERCLDLLTVLWRWQRDPDLTEDSRRRARDLVQTYGKRYVRGRGF